MDTELHKRLEEAENNYAKHAFSTITSVRTAFRTGAEIGYKEAVAQAKEWWWENIDALFGHKITKDEFDNLIADFEADMNELWEGEK